MTCADHAPWSAVVAVVASMIVSTIALFWSTPAQAHTRSLSHSTWTVSGNTLSVTASIAERELTRVGLVPQSPDYRQAVSDYLTTALTAASAQASCTAGEPAPPHRVDGVVHLRWEVACTGAPQRIISGVLADAGVMHVHLASVQRANASTTHVLTPAASSARIDAAGDVNASADNADSDNDAAAPNGVTAFMGLGVRHILSGWDHLAFLLVLLVLAGSLREVVWLATGFALGHSVTLIAAAVGLAAPPAAAVESLIALTIVLAAVEAAWRGDQAHRWRSDGWVAVAVLAALLTAVAWSPHFSWLIWAGLGLAVACYAMLARAGAVTPALRIGLAGVFGLFHGFGFAGFLQDFVASDGDVLPALFGFNLGVEIGQLGFVLVAYPLLRAATRLRLPAAQCATAVTAGLGGFWFLTRAFA